METPGKKPEEPLLSRRQRRLAARKAETVQRNRQAPTVSRRDLLKAVLPGGWIGEAMRGEGTGSLSTPAKISLVKDAALILGPGALLFKKSVEQEKSLKDKVHSFTWDNAQNSEKLEAFVENLANDYLQITRTPRLTKEDLLGTGRTTLSPTRNTFIESVRAVEPSYEPTETQWGYTDYKSRRVFIDLENLKKQSLTQNAEAGLALIDALWHEWGHLDVTERTSGELLNNRQTFFYSPVSNQNELFRKYRGGAVYTDTYYGYLRFEEVWNETITVRRMIEQVGLSSIISARDYYENGIDFFPKFTSAVNIPLSTLYQLHATSDFEGLAMLIGQNLPGNEPPLEKGIQLFNGIHQSNSGLIRETRAFEKIPR